MVVRWGMSEKVGLLSLTNDPDQAYLGPMGGGREYSEQMAALVDSEVKRIIDGSYEEAVRLLTAERARLDKLATALLDRESLDEWEILEVTGLPAKPGRERIGELRSAASAG
jgi:cell division protease FtsH